MQRKNWILAGGTIAAVLGISALILWPRDSEGTQEKDRAITVKVQLPVADAQVSINGTALKGKGESRTLKVSLKAGDEHFTIAAVWEPNNYTKITRKRKVEAKTGNEFEVDLRDQSKQEPDDIVVRYVPTPDDVVDAMCKLGKVTKDDIVYDLGCGDGRMVCRAIKYFGAKRGVGIDLDPERVSDSKETAKKYGVDDKVEFRQGDVLKVKDLSDATVVLLYMGDDINNRLKPILQSTLKPGARVVSHRFLMGDWKPEKSETITSSAGYDCHIHLWTITGKAKD